jgi:hypothetical protein
VGVDVKCSNDCLLLYPRPDRRGNQRRVVHVALQFLGVVAMSLCLGISSGVTAQEHAERSRLWTASGLGSAGIGSARETVAFLLQFTWQKRSHQFTLRGLMASEIGGGGETAGDAGFLYGRGLMGPAGHVSASAGLAYTKVPCGERPFRPTCRTIGLPVLVEAALRIAPVTGIGVQAFGNVNGDNSFAGFVFFLQLGWLPRQTHVLRPEEDGTAVSVVLDRRAAAR